MLILHIREIFAHESHSAKLYSVVITNDSNPIRDNLTKATTDYSFVVDCNGRSNDV